MKHSLDEFQAFLGHSDKYGVHFGPFEDRHFPPHTRIGLRIAVPLGLSILNFGYGTSRVETIESPIHGELLSHGERIIYAHWHRYAQYYYFWARHRRHVIMSSPKDAGEYGARCMARVEILTVRGSTSSRSRTGAVRDKKGKEAIAAMVGLIRDEGFHAGLTVDGPRGPALMLRKGVVALARETGAPIFPMTVAGRPHARLTTWDRMWVPLPFSRIIFFFTGPFYVPRRASVGRLEAIRAEIEAHMQEMAHKAERYFVDKNVRRQFPEPVWEDRA